MEMSEFVQAGIIFPPVSHCDSSTGVDTVTMVPKADVILAADRLFREGRREMATALVTRAGAVKDGQMVSFQPALARKLGLG